MIIGAVLAIPIYSFVIMSVFRVLVFDQPQAAEDVVFGCLIASGGALCYLLAREHYLVCAAVLIITMLTGAGVADLMMDQTPVTELGPSLVFLMAIVLASVVLPSPWSLAISFSLWAVFSTSIVLWALGDIGKDLHYHDVDVGLMGVFLFTLTVLFLVISARVSIRDLLRQIMETRAAENDLRTERVRLAEMQTQFMQNTSHEMRTPLGLILGYSEMIQGGEFGDLGDELSGALDIITRRARELKVLVGDIALILELEDRALAGLHVDREPVAIGAMARMLLNDYALIAKVDGIVLEDNIGDVTVMGSYKMLQRALDNVIRNALKFTSRAGVIRVVVGLEEGKALIEVADTGVGIQPEALPFVFERFYQANGSPTRRFAGSGLGLALVKEVVEAHWGTVTIESEIGVGTTIRLLVPLGIFPS
jgi:signal transduction histidine kinase